MILGDDMKELYEKFKIQPFIGVEDIIFSIVIGSMVGVVIGLYRMILDELVNVVGILKDAVQNQPWMLLFWVVLLIGFAFLMTWLLQREPNAKGSGVPQIKAEIIDLYDAPVAKTLVAKLMGVMMSVCAGLSLGRAGPAIQVGGVLGKWVSTFSKEERKALYMSAGCGAGLAAIFSAPLSGFMFVIEEIHKGFNSILLIITLIACCFAGFITKLFFGVNLSINYSVVPALPLTHYYLLFIIGISCGVLGVLFNRVCLASCKAVRNLAWPKTVKIMIPFLCTLPFAYLLPDVLGGSALAFFQLDLLTHPLWLLLTLFIVKFLFTIVCASSEISGGIFFPILMLGALLGGSIASIGQYLGVPANFTLIIVMCSIAAFFTATIRTPLTAILLLLELCGSFLNLFPIAIVVLISYSVASILQSLPIFDALLLFFYENKE